MPDRLTQLRAALAGRYDLDRPVGEGGMARVWLARDVKHDRRVAVKVLRRELALSIGAERFAREIGIAAKLNHPNIVGVIDSGLIQLDDLTLPYYVMPYVEGPSLRELLGRDGPLAPAEALRFGAEVADALDFAHARGVVHRDIKPGNILIQAGHALVADFGIARAVDLAGRDRAALTTEGILGTPVYMSPEQCRGEDQLDGRSDIYSLGCVLYEVLTGSPPFEAATPQAVSLAHCNAPLPPLLSKRPGLAPEVVRVVEQALAKAPGERFPTAAVFRDALERARGRISGDATTLVAPAGGHRWGWLAAAAVAAVVGLALWRPWAPRVPAVGTGPVGVVVLGGVRDRSGSMATEAALLGDALRQELQRVPALRVLDASDRGELSADSLRRLPGATWVVVGSLDRLADSVGITMRVLDAATGAELGGGTRWAVEPGALVRHATRPDERSVFTAVRSALGRGLAEARLLAREPDSAVRDLRRRALSVRADLSDAFFQLGPTRIAQDLEMADSLLRVAERLRPRGALASYERARLADFGWLASMATRERFPDSTALVAPPDFARRGWAIADSVVRRDPTFAEAWQLLGDLTMKRGEYAADSTSAQQALAAYQRATELGGATPDLWLSRAEAEASLGRFREALYSVRQAESADALRLITAYARSKRFHLELLLLGNVDSAAAVCAASRRDYPGHHYFIGCESEVAGYRSRSPADARRALVLADSIEGAGTTQIPGSVPKALRLHAAAILWRAGLADSGDRVYGRVDASWGDAPYVPLLIDAAYARLVRGDLDSALAVAASVVRADSGFRMDFERQPRFAPLRAEPGFDAAMRGVPPREASPARRGSPGE